jgi:hypothetical protein
MNAVMLIKLMNEGIPLLLLIALGIVTYRGLKKNQFLLAEREDLLRRYILFRGDKHVRLKVYGQDDKVSANFSNALRIAEELQKATIMQALFVILPGQRCWYKSLLWVSS